MKKRMCKILLAVMTAIAVSSAPVFAMDYDFSNLTTVELEALKDQINEVISAEHSPTSDEKSMVEKVTKQVVESAFGAENVEWAWIDYSYTKDWNFYSCSTHADIKKQDGGEARYDVYSEVISDGNNYQLVYLKIGTEEAFNKRSELVSDQRVRRMLGLAERTTAGVENADKDSPEKVAEEEEKSDSQENGDVLIAERGDKGEEVLSIQQMLVRLGYLDNTPDGSFGKNTEKAVKRFQTDNGLEETGTITQSAYDLLKTVAAAAPEPEEVIKISAAELYKEFDNNAIGAEAAYEGKTVQVKGTIESIDKDFLGAPYVVLQADEYGFTGVQCYFSREDTGSLADLRTGQKVSIKGTCGDLSITYVLVRDCVLVD